MKFSKASAIGASAALVVASVLGVGIAASAVTVDVPVASITPETNPYAVNAWFQGTPLGPVLTQDTAGLHITGRNQVLYGHSITDVDGTDFATLIDGASFVGSGNLEFQVPVFFDGGGNTDFATLRPELFGSPEPSGNWVSSQTIPALGLTKDAVVPWSDIVAAFNTAGGDAEVLAFGVLVNAPDSATLVSLTWGPDTWNFATPTAAVVPPAIQGPVTFTG